MQTRFIVTLPLVFAAQAIHAATCAGMVGPYLTADRPNASLCTQASGYSLTNLYTKPTDAQIAAMCASEACKIVVSKTLSMTPVYCPVSPGYDLRADFLERVSACAAQTPIPPSAAPPPTEANPAPVEETPTPTPATTSPAPTPVPTITAAPVPTPSPVEPPTTPSPRSDDPISTPTPTVTAAPVLTPSSAEPSATPQSKDDDSIPTPATTRPLCGSN